MQELLNKKDGKVFFCDEILNIIDKTFVSAHKVLLTSKKSC